MLDQAGILASRSKDVKLRLLNNVKIEQEKTYWQALNILAPLIFLGLFGFVFNFLRNKAYSKNTAQS
jgi:ABC-2 type transport system permease protein